MKTSHTVFRFFLDGIFDSPVVAFFQSLSGYRHMVDGLEYDFVRVVKDGVVTLCFADIGSGDLALIDAGYDRNGKAIKRELDRRGSNNESVKAILLTHGHIDHIGAVPLFPHASVMVLSNDVDLAEGRARSRGALSMLLPAHPTGVKVSHALKDGDAFRLGNRSVRVYAIPGHTPGSTAFLIDDILFLGDSAFAGRDGKMVRASCPFTDDLKQSCQSLFHLAKRLKRENVTVKAMFFSHSSPFIRGLTPLMEFAERNSRYA